MIFISSLFYPFFFTEFSHFFFTCFHLVTLGLVVCYSAGYVLDDYVDFQELDRIGMNLYFVFLDKFLPSFLFFY